MASLAGTNHALPTYGYAMMYGGVSLDTFVKYITVLHWGSACLFCSSI